MHGRRQRPTDEELVAQVRKGDEAAFDALVARHRATVLAVARRVLGDYDQAEDAAQEAFVQALSGLPGLREPEKFAPWVASIARRCATRYRNLAASRPATVQLCEAVRIPIDALEQRMPSNTAIERIRTALGELSARNRQVVALHYLDGYTCREIGVRLGLAVGTVKRILHESRNKLGKEQRAMSTTKAVAGGPKRLVHWINGSAGPSRPHIFDLLRTTLPQAICLAVNKRARTARQIADQVSAHVQYVRETAELLVEEQVLTVSSNGRYLANFAALEADDWVRITPVARELGPKVASAFQAHLPELEQAWANTTLPHHGVGWADGIWPALAILVGNAAVSRNGPPDSKPPSRASGGQYWLGGHEEVAKRHIVWSTGLNGFGGGDGRLSIGYFWTHGLARNSAHFSEKQCRVLTALAKGATGARSAATQTGLSSEETRVTVGELMQAGVVRRRGRRLGLSFPVFGEQESQVLTPVVDRAARELLHEILLPATEGIGAQLEEAGYGRVREQFPVWRRWLMSDMVGEGLRHLIRRSILPRPPRPAPVHFCMVGWFTRPRLLSWQR